MKPPTPLPNCALRLARFGCLFLALVSATAPSAQDAAKPESVAGRPKVGLVLSGGGARGAAHIGVLKVLEELRVPVDVVVGTSMGSIVGAAYATGLSVSEMEKVIKTITTDKLFTDSPPRQDQTMRRKDDDLRPYFVPELAVTSDGVLLPKGLVTGVALEGELRRLVQVTSARSFDELPIPFRAIATDIGTGEMVVLKEGSVVQAIRASMSVPGAVAPVEVGRRQLVDGGLVRNLPVDIARSMGAEIIIAVNLGTPLLKPEQITSALTVSVQMLNILTEQNVGRSLAELTARDILILPELGDYSAADFDNLVKTVPIGEAAARKVADRLRALSLPPDQYAALRGRQTVSAAASMLVIDAVKVEGTHGVSEAVVLQAMQTRIGQPLDRDTIDLDMRRIFGRGDFETVNYAIQEVDGKRTLVVLVKEKPQRNYVRFGLELEAALGDQADFNLLASHRMKWLNAFGGEWRNDVLLGRDVLLQTELYQPLSTRQYFFVAPQLRYSIDRFDLFADDLRVAEYKERLTTGGVDLGVNFLQYGEARLGAVAGRRSLSLKSGGVVVLPANQQAITLPTNGKFNVGAFTLNAKLDRLDSINFPREGYYAHANVYESTALLGADETYTRWNAVISAPVTFGSHTFEGLISGGDRFGNGEVPIYDQFELGGFLNLSGLSRAQLRSDRFIFGRLIYRSRIANFPIVEDVHAGVSLEGARLNPVIPVWRGRVVTGDLNVFAGSIFVGIDSPLGPLFLGFGYANSDNKAVYLFLGRP
ncbi:MAG TPA: patatin-like phospholipase family protein [Burkholderiaceae bacterium]|nr:patatin-like phospholipase family protein [Burkholderiaceae bacterium]